MVRLLLALLLLSLLPPAFAGHNGDRNTQTTVQCLPATANAHQPVTCTAFAQDMYGVAGQRSPPTGNAGFSVTSGPGNLGAASCALAPTGAQGQSSCSVTYTPTAGGTHTITASYAGAAETGDFIGNWLPSSGSGNVLVNNPVPTVTSISPASGLRGATLDVTISGGNFVSTGVSAGFGAGITVNTVTWVNAGTLVANISIAASAATGFRDVTVTNPAPNGGTATLPGAFQVRNPAPAITGLAPGSVEEGSGAVVVVISGSGFVNDSIAYFNGAARTTTFVSSAEIHMDLSALDTAAAGSYPVHVVNAAPGGGTSNTLQFSVVLSGGSFDTAEPNAALGTNMYTKRANVTFPFDILATDVGRLALNASFTGTVRIELLDATDDSGVLDANGCRSSWTLVAANPSQAFSAASNGRISVTTTYPYALRVARFRVSYPSTGTPTHVGCSSDPFSVRPSSLTLATALTNTTDSGAPVHAAGAPFTLTATALGGYDGAPIIDSPVAAHTDANANGVLGGSFPAAVRATGVSTGSAFTYDEVGNFTIGTGKLHDPAFTAVDQPDDCTAGLSNTLSDGKYGCDFANASPVTVGRFIPAYFDVTVLHGCAVGSGFTYSHQPFLVTITARSMSGAVTRNYAVAGGDTYSRDVTLSSSGSTAGFDAPTNTVVAEDFVNGVASGMDVIYTFASAETPFTVITLRAADGDGVSSSGHLEESTQIRSGRLVIGEGTAITSHPGLVSVMLQAWQETTPGFFEWAAHVDDATCTVPAIGDFSLDAASFSGNLDDTETAITGFFFNAGEGMLTLSAPGADNDGSVDIEGAVDDWFYFDAGGGPQPPRGSMTFFEIFETEQGLIQQHEVIN